MSLLVSIHDVAPPHLAAVRRLRAALGRWGVAQVTLLAVPRYHDRLALGACPETTRFLRRQLAAGDEICLHGDRHLQTEVIPRFRDRLRARMWTAGEGECLALSEAARASMLTAGRDLLEDLLGEPIRGFVAPAWLEPRGFHHALSRAGFQWHEGGPWLARLEARGARTVVSRWPVVGFATRTLLRRAVSLTWASLLGQLLGARLRGAAQRAPEKDVLVRVALHPSDLASVSVMSEAETIIRALLTETPARTYAAALERLEEARPPSLAGAARERPPRQLPVSP